MAEVLSTAGQAVGAAPETTHESQRSQGKGLTVSRRWTRASVHPFDEITWELRAATIANEKGEVVFEQKDTEVPNFWSQLATNVVVSKYFRGALGTPQRERSVKQLIGRVANTITDWGINDGYFATPDDAEAFRAELTYLLVNQYAAFNSPVWFNVGIEPRPQCSACQPYHALINTAQGLMPIGEIVENNLIGLPVYDNKGLTQVIAVKRNGRKPVYRVRLNDGFSIEATGDHLACAHEARRTRRVEWRRVDQLRPGMVMRVCTHASQTVTAPAETKVVAEAALAGWLQADGFVGQYAEGTNQSLTIEFITVDQQEFDWVMCHVKEAFPGHHYHISDVKTDDPSLQCRRIRLYGEPLRPFVEQYNLLQRGQNLRVPTPIWTAPNDAAAAYVKSLFQSDGYAAVHVPSAHVAFAVTSKSWAEELQRLLARFGIYARLRQKKEQRPDRYDIWELDISIRSEREAFQRSIGFISERKNAKLRESLKMSGKQCPEVRYSAIVSIEPLGEMEVYDIQTLSGCYLTNSVLVHNCFILSVDDTMESILEWYRNEGMIFKYGSGSGLNVSPIRSVRERLAGGGTASGPVSFMRAADASAGVIKSGGKTRRAAKMVVLNADHPDVKPFILCKWKEEEKAHKLIDVGYDAAIDGEAYTSVFFQNANNSVRATDEFMKRALADEEWDLKAVTTGEVIERVKARDLLRLIAEATWHCGDPGMQFDTTTNDWHTCPNTGRINASNPCSEYVHLDNSACLGPEVRVSTKQGLLSVAELYRRQETGETIFIKTELLSEHAAVSRRGKKGYRPADVYARQLAFRPAVVIKTGRKLLYRIELSTSQTIRLTADHKVLTEEGWKEVRELQVGRDAIVTQKQSTPIDYSEATQEDVERYHMLGWMLGDGYCSERGKRPAFGLVFGPQDRGVAEYLQPVFNRVIHTHSLSPTRTVGISTQSRGVMQMGSTAQGAFQQLVEEYGITPAVAPDKRVPSQVFEAPKILQAAFLGALFSADGTIFLRKNDQVNKPYLLVRLTSTSPQLLSDVQVILFDFGIRSSITWTHPEGRKNPQGTLSVHGYHAYKFCQMIGFPLSDHKRAMATQAISGPYRGNTFAGRRALVERVTEDAVDDVYDISEPVTRSMIAEGLLIHNCNLASINLLKFLDEEGNFLIEQFKYAVRIMIIAQDIVVDNSSYPTAKITQNARDYRELGLGYANLGALLMTLGLAYDSEEGRAWAGAISALMCGHAYEVSGQVAESKGPYAGFTLNREPQVRILRKHRAQVDKINHRLVPQPLLTAAARAWDESIKLGEHSGVRNSQMTVIAPTGTIAFLMDCDTTGIEPDIALVKYKRLVGGGMLKIVNQTVPKALTRLGYDGAQIDAILKHINDKDTIEGAPGLKSEHLSIFDCAFRPIHGTRSIHYMGHVRMMGAVQPFISGAISKTVNMPQEANIEEIMQAYIEAWRLGIKALAIYRDGSKWVQPLSTSKQDSFGKTKAPSGTPYRRRLPDERQAITHKFSVGGHEGYLTVGLFEDGQPGEIFITISKEGSTLSGLMDAFATMVSLSLQYGVPLKVLVNKFSHVRFEPSGVTNNRDIRFAKSVVDYIFRWMALKFLPAEDSQQFRVTEPPGSKLKPATPQAPSTNPFEQQEHLTFVAQADAPACPECGSIMVRNAACYKCLNCGCTSGCS